jgi:hypothetical protein
VIPAISGLSFYIAVHSPISVMTYQPMLLCVRTPKFHCDQKIIATFKVPVLTTRSGFIGLFKVIAGICTISLVIRWATIVVLLLATSLVKMACWSQQSLKKH